MIKGYLKSKDIKGIAPESIRQNAADCTIGAHSMIA